jgi:hypothetical protein
MEKNLKCSKCSAPAVGRVRFPDGRRENLCRACGYDLLDSVRRSHAEALPVEDLREAVAA